MRTAISCYFLLFPAVFSAAQHNEQFAQGNGATCCSSIKSILGAARDLTVIRRPLYLVYGHAKPVFTYLSAPGDIETRWGGPVDLSVDNWIISFKKHCAQVNGTFAQHNG